MTGSFNVDNFIADLDQRLDLDQDVLQDTAQENESAQVSEQDTTQVGDQDQQVVTATETEGGAGGAGGVAVGGDASGGAGLGIGGRSGDIDQGGDGDGVNINFGNTGSADGTGTGGAGGVGGDADASGGRGGDADSDVDVDADATQTFDSDQDSDQDNDSDSDLDAFISRRDRGRRLSEGRARRGRRRVAHQRGLLEPAGLPGAIDDAVAAAGSPWWAAAAQQWWRVERAVVAGDAAPARVAADALAALGADHPVLRVRADAAAVWAAVLAGDVDARAVDDVAVALDAAGRPWEAAQLCRGAAARATRPEVSRALAETGRRLRPARCPRRVTGADELSDREREVGTLVVDGLTHKEIGARLYISPKTVEQHVARLRQKLAVTTRADLVAALRARIGRSVSA